MRVVFNVVYIAPVIIRFLANCCNQLFRKFLLNKCFLEILPPKLIAGTTSQGGASQFYNQMESCGDLERVFVVAPVFKAEGSYMCEDACLDVKMEIMESYSEVMDIVDSIFVEMFDTLNETCQKELDTIGKQYPFKPLKYLRRTLRLTFEEGVQMLKEAGVEVDPLGDLNTESERTLGKLVLEKYGTEFYILHRYPLAVRPFFTMPSYGEGAYSNSFDFIGEVSQYMSSKVSMIREKIILGSQRIHVPELLESRAKECGIDVKTISEYIEAFRSHVGWVKVLNKLDLSTCQPVVKTVITPINPATKSTYFETFCTVKDFNGAVISSVSLLTTDDPNSESDQIWLCYRNCDSRWKKAKNPVTVSFKCVGVNCMVKHCSARLMTIWILMLDQQPPKMSLHGRNFVFYSRPVYLWR
ncbi:class II aminoacyl-tRNA and biotin synthetases superfamily protein [Artemisia annua]|uniref:Class II aminoacyl-tRNA and biotin synthetases superfamily protein n=1 Tax=Artemisia annua TaxID=35608 RepID=A0A2U1NLK4_ARTAN|nr:class II aminoacyl-tRNA and biotin synthetases superfamily protein [Artemisia annua]